MNTRVSKKEKRRKARVLRSGIMSIQAIDHKEPRAHEFELKLDKENDILLIRNKFEEERDQMLEKTEKRVRFEDESNENTEFKEERNYYDPFSNYDNTTEGN